MAAPLADEATALSSSLPSSPLEIPQLVVEPPQTPSSAIEACLVCPSANAMDLNRVPLFVGVDRPLEIEIAVGQCPGARASIARFFSTHAQVEIAVDMDRQSRASVSVPVSVQLSSSSCTARALVHPTYWADASSISVVSLTLAGRLQPCGCLPATLQVGYNRAPAPAGAVHEATKAGNVLALKAALDAGGSTEEADAVCGGRKEDRKGLGSVVEVPVFMKQVRNLAAEWSNFLIVGHL